jgi:hypothetical protein
MRKIGQITAAVLMLAVLLAGTVADITRAATPPTSASGNGYRVSPVRTDLTLAPGSSRTVTVFIRNVSTARENLQVVANDFQAKDETGTPALLLNGQDAPVHGLRKYMTVPTAPIPLQPGEQKAVTVQINLPAKLAAGGYFGAVRFAPVSSTGSNTVNLAASVASLVLVRVSGPVREQLSIASFDVRQNDSPRLIFTSGNNLKAAVRFINNGQVQEVPFGKVLLRQGDNTKASYEINTTDPKANVLPSSIRRFDVSLDKVGKFGKYTVEGNFGYGTNGQLVTAKTNIYVIPLGLIIAVLAAILLILFLIFGLPRMMRDHDRRVLRRANRRR